MNFTSENQEKWFLLKARIRTANHKTRAIGAGAAINTSGSSYIRSGSYVSSCGSCQSQKMFLESNRSC